MRGRTVNAAIDFDNLLSRLIGHIASGTTDQADDIYEMEVAQYTDPVRYQLEVERIFKRTPLLVSLASDLPEVGSFKTLEIAEVPLLLTRSKRGVHAFINLCRHRGARLVDEEHGCKQLFTCPFHAWTFELSGGLRGVPESKNFGKFERSTRGLTELPCEERDGLIWAILTPGETLDLDAHLGPLASELAGFGLQNARSVTTRQLETGNWKIAMDTYMENYHVAFLHRETFAPSTISNVSLVDYYGKHQRMIAPRKVLASVKEPREVNDPISAMALNYNIFPNVVLLVTPEMAMLSRVVPGRDVNHSITVQEFFSFGEFTSEEQEAMFKTRVELTYQAVSTEDYWITDGAQAGLRSGANETFLFGRNEVSLQNFHRQVDLAFDAFDRQDA